MSVTNVTVLCPNARRYVVKVTPSTLLSKVLEEACLSSGYDQSSHELRHQKKVLDLSLPLRISGLPNNATLDLAPLSVLTSGLVTVAVQLSESRLQVECDTTESLHDVLEKAASLSNENLTSVNKDGVPCLSYMNRQYRGSSELKARSLKSIGISGGKILIRYQRIKMDEERLGEIEKSLEDEKKRREEFDKKFQKARAENEERERRDLEAEKHLAELTAEEERKRIEEEEKLSREIEERNEKRNKSENEKMHVEEDVRTAKEPSTSCVLPDRLSSVPSSDSGWSFDRPIFSATPVESPVTQDSSRLDALNALLTSVNDSLSHPSSFPTPIVEAVATRGRLPLSAVNDIISSQTSRRSSSRSVSPSRLPDHCERHAVLVNRSTVNKGAGNNEDELGEEFFELTVEDLKSIQRDRRDNVRAETQRALLPKSTIEARNLERKISAYRHVVVRFQLSRDFFIQGYFLPHEQGSDVYSFISSILRDDLQFSITFINKALKRDETRSLVQLDLAPKATIIVRLPTATQVDESLIRESAEIRSVNLDEADQMSNEWLSGNSSFSPYAPVVAPENGGTKRAADVSPNSHRNSLPDQIRHEERSGSLPKWLKKK